MFFILLLFLFLSLFFSSFLAQSLRNCLSGPAINNSVSQQGGLRGSGRGGCSAVDVCLCLCVFVSMHSHAALNLSLLVPSGHISCNRPSVKARQLTIRGGGGGDYTRGLVSYTITSHIH